MEPRRIRERDDSDGLARTAASRCVRVLSHFLLPRRVTVRRMLPDLFGPGRSGAHHPSDNTVPLAPGRFALGAYDVLQALRIVLGFRRSHRRIHRGLVAPLTAQGRRSRCCGHVALVGTGVDVNGQPGVSVRLQMDLDTPLERYQSGAVGGRSPPPRRSVRPPEPAQSSIRYGCFSRTVRVGIRCRNTRSHRRPHGNQPAFVDSLRHPFPRHTSTRACDQSLYACNRRQLGHDYNNNQVFRAGSDAGTGGPCGFEHIAPETCSHSHRLPPAPHGSLGRGTIHFRT